MATLTFDLSGKGGLAKRFYGDRPFNAGKPEHRIIGKDGQMASGIYNPYSIYGYMSPANNTTKACTGTTSFLLTSAVVVPTNILEGSDDAIHFADEATDGTDGQILTLANLTDTSLSASITDAPPGVSSADNFRVVDMIKYQVNGGQRIYTLSQDLTQPNFGGYIVESNTSFSTHNTIGSIGDIKEWNRPFFTLADNGFLYIFDSNSVHKMDGGGTGGASGTLTENVLTFLGVRGSTNTKFSVATDAVDTRGNMWIGLHLFQGTDDDSTSTDFSGKSFNQECGVYVWDRVSALASIQDFIYINGAREIKAMFLYKGTPACFTTSTEGYTQIRVWNGKTFKIAQTLAKDAYPPYRRHSIDTTDNGITWIGNDGYIYMYASVEDEPDALYQIGDMTAHVSGGETFSASGVLVSANATETHTSGYDTSPKAYYVSFEDSGGNHLVKWYPTAYDPASTAQSPHQGDVYTMVRYLPSLSTVRDLTIYCAPTENSATDTIATLKIYFNQSSTAGITKTITEAEASRGYVTVDINEHNVNAVQMEIEYNTSQNLGTDTFLPSLAILDYDPTNTHSPDNG